MSKQAPKTLRFRPSFIIYVKGKNIRNGGEDGLEPAASGVTGRRSNQLSYTPTEFTASEFLTWISSPDTPKNLTNNWQKTKVPK